MSSFWLKRGGGGGAWLIAVLLEAPLWGPADSMSWDGHILCLCAVNYEAWNCALWLSSQLSRNQTLWVAGQSAKATHSKGTHTDRKTWRQPKVHFSRLHLPHLLKEFPSIISVVVIRSQHLEPLQISQLFFCRWARRSRGQNRLSVRRI